MGQKIVEYLDDQLWVVVTDVTMESEGGGSDTLQLG